jgi:hypothetical protein
MRFSTIAYQNNFGFLFLLVLVFAHGFGTALLFGAVFEFIHNDYPTGLADEPEPAIILQKATKALKEMGYRKSTWP